MKALDLTGQRFGRLVAVRLAGHAGKERLWLCRCDCGTERAIRGHGLRSGNSASCGCVRIESITTHGKWKTPEYQIWHAAKQRCTNPNDQGWKNYGGRGITMCDPWRESFAAFLADMGPRPSANHSIDRIDNAGPYAPENCRWATKIQQSENRRTNHHLTWKGETLTVSQWAKRTGLSLNTIEDRLKGKWPIERVLSLPPDKTRARIRRRA